MKTLALLIPFFFFLSCLKRTTPPEGETKKEGIHTKSLQKSELDTAGLSLSASLFYKTNNYEEAVKEYTKLIELDTTKGRYYIRRAYSLVQLDRHIEAIPDYLKAAELNCEKFICYKSLGITYFVVLKNDSLAIKYFEKCLELDPGASEIQKLLELLKKNSIKTIDNL